MVAGRTLSRRGGRSAPGPSAGGSGSPGRAGCRRGGHAPAPTDPRRATPRWGTSWAGPIAPVQDTASGLQHDSLHPSAAKDRGSRPSAFTAVVMGWAQGWHTAGRRLAQRGPVGGQSGTTTQGPTLCAQGDRFGLGSPEGEGAIRPRRSPRCPVTLGPPRRRREPSSASARSVQYTDPGGPARWRASHGW